MCPTSLSGTKRPRGGARPYGGLWEGHLGAEAGPSMTLPEGGALGRVGGSQIDLTFAIDQGSHNGAFLLFLAEE